jgi:hypothetical protein
LLQPLSRLLSIQTRRISSTARGNKAPQRAVSAALAACAALVAVAAPGCSTVAGRGDAASTPPPGAAAWVVDDGRRIRQEDTNSPLAKGYGNPLYRPGEPVRLAALRGEVVAFQVIVEARGAPLHGATVDVSLSPQGSAQGRQPRIERFVENYVRVTQRSRDKKTPGGALGWSPQARPPDSLQLGSVPDALVPVELAASFCPYPFDVAPRSTGAVWVDVTVPDDAAAGESVGEILVRADGVEVARIPLSLRVHDAQLPYRAVSFLAYYGRDQLKERLGDERVADAELQLWQLLHAHQIDALGSLSSAGDARRLRVALDGTLFTPQHGYHGVGQKLGPAAVAIGAYGGLGDPTPEAKAKIEAIAPLVPATVEDLFVYAVDEQCDSPRGPGFKALLAGGPAAGRVRVAHTCSRDPRTQGVDLVLTTAEEFDGRTAAEARAAGKRVWVYNGALPRAGSMLLDAGMDALAASAWAAATHEVGRWFLWEVAFWNDGNRGGHGPIDPFVQPESFHNRSGDSALLDGALVYPGAQIAPFEAHSLGFSGVVPSMRLKSLRRGIQDAGYLALARAAHPAEADATAARAMPAALDDAPAAGPVNWDTSGRTFFEARTALRALIPPGASLSTAEASRVLGEGARSRAARTAKGPPPPI